MDKNFKNYTAIPGGVCASSGFKASGIHCGIRKNKQKKDLALIYCEEPCLTCAVYTQNKVKGAPIDVTKEHLIKSGFNVKALIANSGNANTCNADGIEKAEKMCELAAQELGVSKEEVIVASTGVIGEVLPIEPIENGIGRLVQSLSEDGADEAANAILTTDTCEKQYAIKFEIDGKECHIGAMAKGSGMIHPNMATMFSFLTSDVNISKEMLDKALKYVVDRTFNMISVDGDTSTNDMVSLMTNKKAGNQKIVKEDENYNIFVSALYVVLKRMSKALAADGEGATKLIECKVVGAKDEKSAQNIAKSVICSSLFKSAVFGMDANWGRILCAIGYAEADFDISKVSVYLKSKTKDVMVCKNGAGVVFSEDLAQFILSGDEVKIIVDLHDGNQDATAWGCDLTYDYVKINGDYRT